MFFEKAGDKKYLQKISIRDQVLYYSSNIYGKTGIIKQFKDESDIKDHTGYSEKVNKTKNPQHSMH